MAVEHQPRGGGGSGAGQPVARERRQQHHRVDVHHTHRDVTGGWLRPAVFGAMDGLVSNFALITAFAGGNARSHTVMLAGLGGLAAGAFSMAIGEYTSVTSQRELALAEIAIERREIARAPEAEVAELAGIYRRRGVEPHLARKVAQQMHADPEQAWRIHAREELGIDPDDLPSGFVAATASFWAFAVGALLPVLPYIFGFGGLLVAMALTAVSLFAAGAVVSRFTLRTWWYSGLRQLIGGAIAAAVTFGIGSAIGASGVG